MKNYKRKVFISSENEFSVEIRIEENSEVSTKVFYLKERYKHFEELWNKTLYITNNSCNKNYGEDFYYFTEKPVIKKRYPNRKILKQKLQDLISLEFNLGDIIEKEFKFPDWFQYDISNIKHLFLKHGKTKEEIIEYVDIKKEGTIIIYDGNAAETFVDILSKIWQIKLDVEILNLSKNNIKREKGWDITEEVQFIQKIPNFHQNNTEKLSNVLKQIEKDEHTTDVQ